MLRRVFGYTLSRGSDLAASEASQHLEREGWVLVKRMFSAQEVEALRSEINAVFDDLPPDGRSPQRSVEDDDHFRYEMLNRSPAAQKAVAHDGIFEVLEPLLGEDYHIIANTAWRNPPASDGKHGGQAWHIDAGPHVPLPSGVRWPADIPHPVFAVGAHIYLQDCVMEDGPTGVIPGSHLSGRVPPADSLMDDGLEYEGQGVVPLLAEAGDVGFFVSDIWHRRMPTQPGDHGRFFLQGALRPADIAQRLRTTEETHQLSDAALARAADFERPSVFGLHPARFYDG